MILTNHNRSNTFTQIIHHLNQEPTNPPLNLRLQVNDTMMQQNKISRITLLRNHIFLWMKHCNILQTTLMNLKVWLQIMPRFSIFQETKRRHCYNSNYLTPYKPNSTNNQIVGQLHFYHVIFLLVHLMYLLTSLVSILNVQVAKPTAVVQQCYQKRVNITTKQQLVITACLLVKALVVMLVLYQLLS